MVYSISRGAVAAGVESSQSGTGADAPRHNPAPWRAWERPEGNRTVAGSAAVTEAVGRYLAALHSEHR